MTHVKEERISILQNILSVGNRYKADEFAVAVLEKVAKLEDEEEVAGLVEDAQGRRALDSPPPCKSVLGHVVIKDIQQILFFFFLPPQKCL